MSAPDRIAIASWHQRAIQKDQPVGCSFLCARGGDVAGIGALDRAMIEDRRRIPKNEVIVSGDEAVSEILPRLFIDKQRILIAQKPNVIENGAVRGTSH